MSVKSFRSPYVNTYLALFFALALLCANSTYADNLEGGNTRQSFSSWVADFKQEALLDGISQSTLDIAFRNIKPLPQVLKLDTSQPEFIRPFSDYIEKRITPDNVSAGQALLARNKKLLSDVAQQYGVPSTILVSFWGMETGYGKNTGNISTVGALATLAYDGRRQDFFRSQLMDAMRILEAKHVTAFAMRGSWAGAMGHMQFMPSTFMRYGVDADNNGHIDIWKSLPDAMGSAANYLAGAGWVAGEPVAIEVQLPAEFTWKNAQLNVRKSVADWDKLGVKTTDGTRLPLGLSNAAIVLPQGWQGPAFMVFSNFDVVLDWNRSVNYALCISILADKYENKVGIESRQYTETGALSFVQMKELQRLLITKGLDVGKVDGFPGLQTQVAIRAYQSSKGLPEDGYASPSLLAMLQAD